MLGGFMKRIIQLVLLSAILLTSASFSQLSDDGKSYYLMTNSVSIPFNIDGTIAFGLLDTLYEGRFNDKVFLFSGGFFLTGNNENFIWVNGVAAAARIHDYLPGPVGSNPEDYKNKIYHVRSHDSFGSAAWEDWRTAVSLGAEFYDGDGDEIYNPIDKNNNGKWDLNEDRPNLLGHEMIWFVLNDGVRQELRRFNDVPPQGIEIHQSAFIYKTSNVLNNIVFIRYKIINKGTENDFMDSVYFGIWADPDIGEVFDDLVGCDTLINAGFTYNDGTDNDWGLNPPAFMINILQGPPAYIPGISFIDQNNNNIFDEEDIPLTEAILNNGYLSIDTLPGAKNLPMTSFVNYPNTYLPIDPGATRFTLMNWLKGLDTRGKLLDPCTLFFGSVLGNIDCKDVNPIYWYSGDPVEKIGWINNLPSDQRMMLNTGPFVLEKDKPIDIIIAYIVGQGEDALSSITEARNIQKYAAAVYENNFYIDIPSEFEEEEITPKDFILYQNYPNPFNPGTKINYDISKKGFVSLRVYNLIGELITELVNEEKEPGKYSVNFNPVQIGIEIPSGMYIVRLKAGIPVRTIKMIYLK
jgi:hypothetical protein